MKLHYRKLAVVALTSVAIIAPTIAQSATPTAMLEKSASYALNKSVYAFRVPTVDSLGKIKYYDVTIDLLVNANGTLNPTANVNSVLSPTVGTANIVPGTYKATGGTETCVVTNQKLTNGRTQSFFKCDRSPSYYPFEFSVVTGGVSSGHPYLAGLLAKKVNTRTDVNTQNWGLLTAGSYFHIGGCDFSFTPSGVAVGVTTDGNQIAITVISNSTPPNTYCVPTMTKTP